MAYSGVATVTQLSVNDYEITIAETEAKNDSEVTIQLPFLSGRVHRQKCELTAGTGTTVDPLLGEVTNPTTNDLIVENDAGAVQVDNAITGGTTFATSDGALYHRSVPNDATADHTISTVYHISRGW